MRLMLLLAVLATLAGCASSLPVRDFRADFDHAPTRDVKIEGYPPFVVHELKAKRRLKVRLNLLAQALSWTGDPLELLGLSDGIPPQRAHEAAARQYLADTGRGTCAVTGAAITPNGREFEFVYTCP